MPNDKVSASGYLLGEIVSNARKHGLEGRPGTLALRFARSGDTYTIAVTDPGKGFDLEKTDQHSFGYNMVFSLVHQIGGALSVNTDHGTTVYLDIPVQDERIIQKQAPTGRGASVSS